MQNMRHKLINFLSVAPPHSRRHAELLLDYDTMRALYHEYGVVQHMSDGKRTVMGYPYRVCTPPIGSIDLTSDFASEVVNEPFLMALEIREPNGRVYNIDHRDNDPVWRAPENVVVKT